MTTLNTDVRRRAMLYHLGNVNRHHNKNFNVLRICNSNPVEAKMAASKSRFAAPVNDSSVIDLLLAFHTYNNKYVAKSVHEVT